MTSLLSLPDPIHWTIMSYLTSLEDNKLTDDAANYIRVIKVTQIALNNFFATCKKGKVLQVALPAWKLSKLPDLTYTEMDSDEEQEVLEKSPVDFTELSAQNFAIALQDAANHGHWKTVAKIRATRRKIPANTYFMVVTAAYRQGETEKFKTLIQGNKLDYKKLLDIFKRCKSSCDAYNGLKETGHYAKMSPDQQQQLEALFRKSRYLVTSQ